MDQSFETRPGLGSLPSIELSPDASEFAVIINTLGVEVKYQEDQGTRVNVAVTVKMKKR